MSSVNGSPAPTRKPLKYQPKAASRRSKAERDALEAEDRERQRVREAAAAQEQAEAEAARRAQYGLHQNDGRGGGFRDRGRGGRGGRGGYMGSRPNGIVVRPPTMHFGSGGGGSGYGGGGFGGRGGGGGGGGGGTSIKREPGIKREPDGDIAMLGIKQEQFDGGYIDSDNEDSNKNQDVEYINLVEEGEDETGGKKMARAVSDVVPVRVRRQEHKQRQTGLNTEASSETSALLRKAAEEGKANKSLDAAIEDAVAVVEKKTKVRNKSVEVTGSARRWKGVYEDSDDEVSNVRIKPEPTNDDAAMPEAAPEEPTQIDSDDDEEAAMEDQNVPLLGPGQASSEVVKIKQEKRRRSIRKRRPRNFQSKEEEAEWEKQELDFATMQEELGRASISAPAATEGNEEGSEARQADVVDRKQDAIYLFQFPPVLPELEVPFIKKEPVSPEVKIKAKKAMGGDTADTAIKVEEGEEDANRPPKFPAGRVGKLRVHKSGRATMTWGGTNLELNMGTSASFLQTAILTQVEPIPDPKEGAPPPKILGKAISFGQIRGKLVVTPDWTNILAD